jgi:glycosyltransferase involved in cell wall biosynthesis
VIHLVPPPASRGSACPFVQRTRSVQRILDLLGEPNAWFRESRPPAAGDLVFYSFPEAQQLHPGTIAIECGVGWDAPPWGPWRVYESEAWRHYSFGRYPAKQTLEHRRNSWVIPWAFDHGQWELGAGAGGYVSYLGRIAFDKGIRELLEMARARPSVRFKVASEDGALPDCPPNVSFVGPIYGTDRSKFLGDAVAHLCATEYVEPLGGTAIEAMLCGTRVIASNYGGFTETIIDGMTGRLCSSVAEMLAALDEALAAPSFARPVIRTAAVNGFSINAALPKWRRALEQMRALPPVGKENAR